MRFAGSRIEGFLGDDRPDFGQMSINKDTRDSKYVAASNEAEAYVGATGIKTAGEVEAAGIIGDAQAGLAQAQGQAAMMKGIGSIASSALGAFGSAGGGGASGFGGSDFNATDAQTMGVSQAQTDWLSTPGNYAETVIDGNGIGPTSFKSWDF